MTMLKWLLLFLWLLPVSSQTDQESTTAEQCLADVDTAITADPDLFAANSAAVAGFYELVAGGADALLPLCMLDTTTNAFACTLDLGPLFAEADEVCRTKEGFQLLELSDTTLNCAVGPLQLVITVTGATVCAPTSSEACFGTDVEPSTLIAQAYFDLLVGSLSDSVGASCEFEQAMEPEDEEDEDMDGEVEEDMEDEDVNEEDTDGDEATEPPAMSPPMELFPIEEFPPAAQECVADTQTLLLENEPLLGLIDEFFTEYAGLFAMDFMEQCTVDVLQSVVTCQVDATMLSSFEPLMDACMMADGGEVLALPESLEIVCNVQSFSVSVSFPGLFTCVASSCAQVADGLLLEVILGSILDLIEEGADATCTYTTGTGEDELPPPATMEPSIEEKEPSLPPGLQQCASDTETLLAENTDLQTIGSQYLSEFVDLIDPASIAQLCEVQGTTAVCVIDGTSLMSSSQYMDVCLMTEGGQIATIPEGLELRCVILGFDVSISFPGVFLCLADSCEVTTDLIVDLLASDVIEAIEGGTGGSCDLMTGAVESEPPTEETPDAPAPSPTDEEEMLMTVEDEFVGLFMTLLGVDSLSEEDIANWEKTAQEHAEAFFLGEGGLQDLATEFTVTSQTPVLGRRGRRQLQAGLTLVYTQTVMYRTPEGADAVSAETVVTEPFATAQLQMEFTEMLQQQGGGLADVTEVSSVTVPPQTDAPTPSPVTTPVPPPVEMPVADPVADPAPAPTNAPTSSGSSILAKMMKHALVNSLLMGAIVAVAFAV